MKKLLLQYVVLFFIFFSTLTFALSTEEVYEKANKAIYSVYSLSDDNEVTFGSAVAVRDNILVSNCHVVLSGNIVMINYNKNIYPSFILYQNKDKDLCILFVPELNSSYVSIRKSSTLHIGEEIYAIGNPRESNRSISKGIISNIQDEYIFTDTSTAEGSSGGGLFDENANLVGITTLASTKQGDSTISIPTDWIITAFPGIDEPSTGDESSKELNKVQDSIESSDKEEPYKIGEYGNDTISVYKSKNGCFLFWNGKLGSGNIFSSVLWSPTQKDAIIIFPGTTSLTKAFNILSSYDGELIEASGSYIVLNNTAYELRGVSHDDLFPFLLTTFDKENLTEIFSNSSYFVAKFKYKNGFTQVIFGLSGFKEAYSKCIN